MIHLLKALFYFFGSIYFALILILCSVIMVVSGTFIESATGSHQYAALYTYGNPLFIALLWGFFLNIFLATLRRWPFRRSHIPFIITHCGLLMILGGSLVKAYFGTQGILILLEGTYQDKIILPEKQVIALESRQENKSTFIPLNYDLFGNPKPIIQPNLKLLAYQPNASETFEAWYKGDRLFILGHKPFPITASSDYEERDILIDHDPNKRAGVIAFRSENGSDAVRSIFMKHAIAKITDAITGNIVFEGTLEKAIEIPIYFGSRPLNILVSAFDQAPKVSFFLNESLMEIDLTGSDALINKSISCLPYCSFPLKVDLVIKPKLIFTAGHNEKIDIWHIDPCGRLFTQSFEPEKLQSLFSYDKGYGGYTVQVEFPYYQASYDRQAKENAILQLLEKELEASESSAEPLAVPLQKFREAALQAGQPFAKSFIAFIESWNNSLNRFYPQTAMPPNELEQILQHLDFNNQELKSTFWIARMTDNFLEGLKEGKSLYEQLIDAKWPLALQLEKYKDDPETLLTILAQQIFSIGELLPAKSKDNVTAGEKARYFSAYLTVYGLRPSTLLSASLPEELDKEYVADSIRLETSLTARHRREEPLKKLEENKPQIVVELRDKQKKEVLSLLYDKFATGYKWPALSGNYLVRFQSEVRKIPYQVRLRLARQVSYPGTNQPFSYEADLMVKDLARGVKDEKRISMNNVYETWDGYRFYLSNISSEGNQGAKQVQIAVNFDPGKYYLTYPGGILLALGIVLLFWRGNRKRKGI